MWAISILGLALGVTLGYCFARFKNTNHNEDRRELAAAADKDAYLKVLRRELANYLVSNDPRKFLKLSEEMHREVTHLETISRKRAKEGLLTLAEKYPVLSDFDVVAVREHVLYADALAGYTYAEISDTYRNIVRLQALNHRLDPRWRRRLPMYDSDLEHLREYHHQVLDTKLRMKIARAIEEYYHCRGDSYEYETDDVMVKPLPSYGDNRKGIHFKRTDEHAIYSFYIFDDGNLSTEYYRCDSEFANERRLHNLYIENWLEESYNEAC